MKIKRTVVIASLAAIVGVGVIGVSPAFATDWGAVSSLSSALKSVEQWEYDNGGPTFESQRLEHALEAQLWQEQTGYDSYGNCVSYLCN